MIAEQLNQTTGYMGGQPDSNKYQMNRLQYVQYECMKTEMKDEYDKRVKLLHNRIEKRSNKQGPYQDAHLVLM